MQRAHAAQKQPCLERPEHGAAAAAHVADALPECIVLRRRQSARDHIGMAIQIFGRRMHHDVRAERDRARQQRRRGGRVDGHDRADLAGDLTRRSDVGDFPGRIGGRLDPDEARSRFPRFLRKIVDR